MHACAQGTRQCTNNDNCHQEPQRHREAGQKSRGRRRALGAHRPREPLLARPHALLHRGTARARETCRAHTPAGCARGQILIQAPEEIRRLDLVTVGAPHANTLGQMAVLAVPEDSTTLLRLQERARARAHTPPGDRRGRQRWRLRCILPLAPVSFRFVCMRVRARTASHRQLAHALPTSPRTGTSDERGRSGGREGRRGKELRRHRGGHAL